MNQYSQNKHLSIFKTSLTVHKDTEYIKDTLKTLKTAGAVILHQALKVQKGNKLPIVPI